jgi:hypothetical protein
VVNENELQKLELEQDFDIDNLNTFEEIIEDNFRDTLVQNILGPQQIVDNNSKSLILALGKGFQPFGIFCDKYLKDFNFPRLFFGHGRPLFSIFISKDNSSQIDKC